MSYKITCSLAGRVRVVSSVALALVLLVGLRAVVSGAQPALSQTCQQLLLNADFENGAEDWDVQSGAGSQIIVPQAAHAGDFGVRLGGMNQADDRLAQWISFPETLGDLELTFFYRVETLDTSNPPTDSFTARLLDDNGDVVLNLVQLTSQNVNGQWVQRVRPFEAAELALLGGRRLRLQLRGTTDGSAPTTFFVDDVGLEACTGGPPAITDLRMSPSVAGEGTDHFSAGTEQVTISFDYGNVQVEDEIRLLIRDVYGATLLDHTYGSLRGSGTRHVIFTAQDAVDGLMHTAVDAGNSVMRHAESALQAESRFALAPYLERVILGISILNDATVTLRDFDLAPAADAHLAEAQAHVETASASAQAALAPASDLLDTKAHVETAQDEIQVAMLDVAQARSVAGSESLTFPETTDCRFNLTNVYLNEMPAASIEWTTGMAGEPAQIHLPQDRRRSGLHVRPLTLYTQQVVSADAPHQAEIAGRVIDKDCRPVLDGTPITFSLADPALGRLVPDRTETDNGYFATSFQTTEDLGDGVVDVRARVGDLEATGLVFLVGPPATVTVEAEASTVEAGRSVVVLARVVDALGQSVADGTEVTFSVSPPDAGRVTPGQATTADGYAPTMFVAGDTTGRVTIRARAGDVEDVAVIDIVDVPATATPTPTSTATPTPTSTPTPTPTPRPACDPSAPDQMCGGTVSVRVFEDARCDVHFDGGLDRALIGVPVSLIYPDGTSILRVTDPSGYVYFNDVQLRGNEHVALMAEYPEDMVTSGLTPCDNSGTLTFLGRPDFGSFGTASVTFRTHRQIVVRRGVLKEAEASLCFTASYYIEPTDGGPVAYLVTEEDLSAYLGQEIEVTGSTWELEFCRYLMPFSIELVP